MRRSTGTGPMTSSRNMSSSGWMRRIGRGATPSAQSHASARSCARASASGVSCSEVAMSASSALRQLYATPFDDAILRSVNETTAAGPSAAFDGRVPPPEFVNIETTRFCNLRCRMCVPFNDGQTVAGPHMELAEFERIATSVFPYVSRWQPTVSGEPTMAKNFDRMLALAGHFGVKAELFTNGTLLSDAMIERLAPNAVTVTISFDGATSGTFEKIREGAEFADV